MKIRLLKLFAAIAALLLSGCVKDIDKGIGRTDEVKISLTLKLPATSSSPQSRAITPTPGEENEVRTIDILCLTQKGDRWVYDYPAEIVTRSTSGNELTVTATVKEMSHPQQFVILVNAEDELLAANPRRNQYIEDIELALVCDAGGGEWPARNNGTGTFKPIPMYARTGEVTVSSSGGSIGNYNLLRMVARINITLKNDIGIGDFQLKEACLFNYKTAGYISYGFSGPDAAGNYVTAAAVPPAGDHTGDPILQPTVMYQADHSVDSRGEIKYSIYTFESPAMASEAERLTGTALVVGGYYNGNTNEVSYYRIDLKTSDDNTTAFSSPLLRNHSYNVEIQSVSGSGYPSPERAYKGATKIEVGVTDWDLGGNIIMDPEGQRYLWVSDLEHVLGGDGGTVTMTIETDSNNWTAVVSESASEPMAGGASWLTVTPESGSGGTHTLTISAGKHYGPERTGCIHIVCDNRLSAVINVNQEEGEFHLDDFTYTPMYFQYVGAFWKKDQTGERLIRITRESNDDIVDGSWTAYVVEGWDWIILDTNPSADPNIYTSSAADMNTNDASYQVSGSAIEVKGNCADNSRGEIFFRIGLKNKWSEQPGYDVDNAPARYGLILLSYNNDSKYHLIFVRQGEEEDFLFRPEDPTGNNSLTPSGGVYRPNARRFTPYNLTTAAIKAGGDMVDAGIRGGIWTDYPSQAGAFFKWAGAAGEERYAYSPVLTNNIPEIYNASLYWDDLKADHETCPPGYRRPNDGPTDDEVLSPTVPDSEMRQSLLLNPFAGRSEQKLIDGNFYRGYLADGYFDRRLITDSRGHATYSTVEPDSPSVAYVGQLLYNPENYASLFFPASGYRNLHYLGSDGYHGYSWTSSAMSSINGWVTTFDREKNIQYYSERKFAWNIRCVRE